MSMPPDTIRLLIMTCPPDQAEALVRTALDERLIACGNILPGVLSRYWWQGAVCSDSEALVIMETAATQVERTITRLTELHPYEVPKILAFTPSAAVPAYLEWVVAQTSRQTSRQSS